MDDLPLIERLRKGDEAAFAELFERHKAAVYRYAVHMRSGATTHAAAGLQKDFNRLTTALREIAREDAAGAPPRIESRIAAELRTRRTSTAAPGDPRTGTVEYRRTNINRAEPLHDLFVVPPDYTIVEARNEERR